MPSINLPSCGRRWLASVLATGLFIGVATAIFVVSESSLDVQPASAAAFERECDEIRHRFGDSQPYVTIELRGERRVAAVRGDLEPRHPESIRTLHGVAWSPKMAHRLRASTPYWVFQVTRWKANALTRIVRPFDQQLGLDVELPDLAPFGRGLVLDERYPDGRRILMWTD